jgi:hypothetical protein
MSKTSLYCFSFTNNIGRYAYGDTVGRNIFGHNRIRANDSPLTNAHSINKTLGANVQIRATDFSFR